MRILGCDIAGRVEAVGDDVTTFQPGDEVYGDLCESGFGAFAEYACAPHIIDVGRIQPRQKLLLNGAGGGVGTLALQIAKLSDVEVTVVDKRGKLDMLRALGADHAIDYFEEDFTRGDRRYDLILDVKTNRSPYVYLRVLNAGGAYVTVGGNLPRLFHVMVLSRWIRRSRNQHVRLVGLKPNKDLAYMSDLFEAGKLVPVIDRTYELAEVPEAFRRFGTGDHHGKIIVTMAA